MTDPTNMDILIRRAALLVSATDEGFKSEETDERLSPCLVVSVNPHKYVFPLNNVTEVLRLDELTFLPGFPSYIAGIFPYRGLVLTAIDLRKFLDLPTPGITQLDRIVVLHSDLHSMGVLIDRVEGVENIELDSLQKITGLSITVQGIIQGVQPNGNMVLDVMKLFSEARLTALARENT